MLALSRHVCQPLAIRHVHYHPLAMVRLILSPWRLVHLCMLSNALLYRVPGLPRYVSLGKT